MLALLLAKNIATLFVIVLIGFILVRSSVLNEQDGKALSTLLIYVLSPAIIVTSLEVDFSWNLAAGMLLAIIAALAMQLLAIGTARLLSKPLSLSPIERGSIGYSNSANLLIPLIIATL